MKNFWLTPIRSLFDLKLYQFIIQSGGFSLGFKYLAYLSCLASALCIIFYYGWIMPASNDFFDWLEKDMPVMAYNTEAGLVMTESQPVTLNHPVYGNLIVFDRDGQYPSIDQISKSPIYVTAKNIFYEKPTGGIAQIDLLRPGQGNRQTILVLDLIKRVRAVLVPLLGILAGFIFFPVFFLFKLVSALLFSLLGLFIALFRKNKINYASVLSITFFASTAMTLLDVFKLTPAGRILMGPAGDYLAFFVTFGYLVAAIKFTDQNPDNFSGAAGKKRIPA